MEMSFFPGLPEPQICSHKLILPVQLMGRSTASISWHCPGVYLLPLLLANLGIIFQMIWMELWQFVSTEDLASLSDTHPGGLAFAELYPYLLNQLAWSDSPFCQVLSWPDVSSMKLYICIRDISSMAVLCVTLWHIWQSSTGRVQSWWNSSEGTWQRMQEEQKKNEASKWMKLVES